MSARALVVGVGSGWFAIPAEAVQCVLGVEGSITPVPSAPVWVRGVSVHRGRPLIVLDASARLGVEGVGAPTRWVVLDVGARVAALPVERVLGLRPLEEVRPSPEGARFAAGLLEVSEGGAVVLDVSAVLAEGGGG